MPEPAPIRPIAPDAFGWVIETASRACGLPPRGDPVPRTYALPLDVCALQTALEARGMECMLAAIRSDDLVTADGIWFALLDRPDADAAAEAAPQAAGPPATASIARVSVQMDGWVRLTDHRSGVDTALPSAAFRALYAGYALRVRRPDVDAEGAGAIAGGVSKFGYRWFGRALLRHRPAWRHALLASLCIQLLALVVPLLTQVVIDKVMTHRTGHTLAVIAAGMLIVTVFSCILGWLRQYYVVHAGTRVDAVLAADVFAHLLRLPARYFEHRATGVLVARLHGVEVVRDFMTGAALALLLDLPFMLLFLAVMLYYSPLLTAVAVTLLAVLIVVSIAGTPLLRRCIDAQFLAGSRHQAYVTERLAGIETVKALQLEPTTSRRFELLYAAYLEAGVRARMAATSLGTIAQGVEQLLPLAVLCAGAWLVVEGGGPSVGALIAFQMFASRLTAPALRMAGLWQEFQQVHVAVKRLADIMDVPPEPRGSGLRTPLVAAGHLSCRGLGFRHGDRPWLFREVSFDLAPGRCIALVGPSGSGKSTFARLLQGFYLADEGRLSMDGVDSTRMGADAWRAYFGVVPQETRLFAGTVLDNLLEAAPAAGFDAVTKACRAAGVHETIASLCDGYETRLGENGTGLSGGQKQRLAIARAMLKGARILVFDEATSSLDAELADALIDTINGLAGTVSVVFIGHRCPDRLVCDAVVDLAAHVPEAQR